MQTERYITAGDELVLLHTQEQTANRTYADRMSDGSERVDGEYEGRAIEPKHLRAIHVEKIEYNSGNLADHRIKPSELSRSALLSTASAALVRFCTTLANRLSSSALAFPSAMTSTAAISRLSSCALMYVALTSLANSENRDRKTTVEDARVH